MKHHGPAQNLIYQAVRDGKLPPPSSFICADCERPATEYDHRDYNRPLDVEAVCHSCNKRRGPAIPLKGFFSEMFRTGKYPHCRNRKHMEMLFGLMGISADLSHLPAKLEFEHWLPFKDVLLEWDTSYQTQQTAAA